MISSKPFGLYGLFIFTLLLLVVTAALLLSVLLPWYWVLLFCIVLAILFSVWIVRLLFTPLAHIAKNLDTLVKETLHELNIPIATIQANSTMLSKHLIDPKPLRQLARIVEASNHLLALHKNLGYMIGKEFSPPARTHVELESFLHARVEDYRLIYPHVLFTLNVVPYSLTTDEHALQKAIDNLIANSVKYTPKHPCIAIDLTPKGVLTITDNGIGMDESTLLHVFERYYQAAPAQEGFGIGLSLVKSFCDTEKIRFSITSQPHRFTKVVLHFPKSKGAE